MAISTPKSKREAPKRNPLSQKDEKRVVALARLFPDDAEKANQAVRYGREALKVKNGLRRTKIDPAGRGLTPDESGKIEKTLGITKWAQTYYSKR